MRAYPLSSVYQAALSPKVLQRTIPGVLSTREDMTSRLGTCAKEKMLSAIEGHDLNPGVAVFCSAKRSVMVTA